MAEEQLDFSGRKINTSPLSSTGFGTKYASATAGLSPMSDDYTPLFKNVAGGKSPFGQFLGIPLGFSENELDSPQNAPQKGESGSGGLMDLYSSLVGLLGGKGRAEDIGAKWKLSASGVPFRSVDMSAKEHRDISGNLVKDAPEQGFKMRSGIEGAGSQWKGQHSWEEGSTDAMAVRNATNAAAQNVLPQIKAQQQQRAANLSAMGFDPVTKEKIPNGGYGDIPYDPTSERNQILGSGRSALSSGLQNATNMYSQAASIDANRKAVPGRPFSTMADYQSALASQGLRNASTKASQGAFSAMESAAKQAASLPEAGTLRSIQSQYGSAYSSPTGSKIEPLRKKLFPS